jgi:hypothetical protein
VESPGEHSNELSGCIKFEKFLSSCTAGSFSRKGQLHEVKLHDEEK